ncbi:DoxX family protein [Colwellia sp. M166]|uniref:HvfX family Cu-binding RiPP maturation protein n=1 Tax=Colwellia sp. M166 TaxID=2583805 RepID=UPI00211DF240|nr:DoxX family protein [Colwellia sp. M166]UUO25388.1 DoxX family protein [Colwellia sp. M166]|tara:strand:- start:6174 stop:6776 length:603 start_codon:yes stop_codon:yes gene_type:complete
MVKALLEKGYCILNSTKKLDFIAPLLMRLYLVPIFWMAGTHKIDGFDNIVQWFGNDDWGLGLPFPFVLAILAIAAEVIGAIALLLGLGVRLMAVPMMFTMIIAMTSVHGQYGWQAIADANAPFANERVEASVEKKEIIISLLQEHGNYEWLTSSGNITILNNGIEFAATYFIMLLALFFIGVGRYVSLDYWLKRKLLPNA